MFRDAVSSSHHLHFSDCPVVTCEYVGHLIFSLHIDCCTFLGIAISFLLELSVWCSVCGPYFMMRNCMLAHCNAVPFVISSLFVL